VDITFPDPSNQGAEDDQVLSDTLNKYDNIILAARYYFENGDKQVEYPNDTLMASDPTLGWINVQLDEDGFVRMIPIFSLSKQGAVEALSVGLSRIYLNEDPIDYRVVDDEFVFAENITIPTITQRDSASKQDVHSMYINYFAEPNKYTHVSFVDLVNGNYVDKKGAPIDFRDKIVIIGPTAIDLQDDYLSPVSQGVRMPGVEIHANNVQTIITQQFLRDQSTLSLWLILIGFLALNLFLFSFLKLRFALPLVIVEIFGMLIAGIIGYEFRTFVNVVYPILVILLSFVGVYLLRFILEQKERKFIEGAFGHYVNKDVVNQILKNPKMLELGGAKRSITVFFSDIAGFTTISEKMEPGDLVSFLNEYLQEMTNIILKYQGTLDKYEGDAIMAFWNAPIAQHDHPLNSCLAALENQSKLAELRKKWAGEGKPEVRIRIGINTGDAVVGNMGSENRFDYTAMGDNINLGSRLEGINKQYGTEIIISEATYKEVEEKLVCRELDLIRVKGKTAPVVIYELVGEKGKVKQEILDRNAKFAGALRDYRSKNFMAAKEKFSAITGDIPSEIFTKRCDEFMQNPPSVNWDGVYIFTTK
ncbi:adenylate/guanylate cyclase domain-containing protein, partial [Patescibacteria group bacterium]|nr:adenylate/guanylate cyclase domain-containing protein [Patescibacteria group bacterium]